MNQISTYHPVAGVVGVSRTVPPRPERWMRCSGDPAPLASRKLSSEVERLSIDLGSYGGFLFTGPARWKRADVSRGARNA